MEIIERTSFEEDDCRSALSIRVETDRGIKSVSFRDGEPEDSNMSRGFEDVYNISGILKLAYDAGRDGEKFKVRTEDVEWEEF